jgi:hypothetical protein
MITMSSMSALANLALCLIVLGLYWLPSILGFHRRRPDLVTVVVVNALLGWTVVGWVVVLGRVLRRPSPTVLARLASARSSVRTTPRESRQVELTDLR